MIFLHGDFHGNFKDLIKFVNKMELTSNDTIIVLGDMGLCWRNDKIDLNYFVEIWESTLKNTPYLYFIDGNHENFDILKEFKDGVISPHIRWLQRGTVLHIDGYDCLCIGGADSIDKHRRVEHLSWWEDEQITKEDVNNIWPGHYDYVFSHCCPYSVFEKNYPYLADPQFAGKEFDHTSEERLDEIMRKIDFDHWYFGHYHHTVDLDKKFTCLYNDFILLGEDKENDRLE